MKSLCSFLTGNQPIYRDSKLQRRDEKMGVDGNRVWNDRAEVERVQVWVKRLELSKISYDAEPKLPSEAFCRPL